MKQKPTEGSYSRGSNTAVWSRKIRAEGRPLLVFCTRVISKDRKLNKVAQKREPQKNRKTG